MKVDVYTKSGCGFCIKAKNWLAQNKIEYTEYTLGGNATKEDIQARLVKMGSSALVKTVPQIFYNSPTGDKYIGGYDALSALNKDYFTK